MFLNSLNELGDTADPELYFMKKALEEALAAFEKDEVPVGAVVVHKNRIISRAHNLTETLTDVTAHAEMQAITAASAALNSKYLNECTLYVTLEPCPMCAAALRWSQIGRVVYGARDEKNGYLRWGEGMLHPRTEVRHGLMAQECSRLMTEFFKGKRLKL
jgi:tRNA(adenine34) deaminase